MSASTTVRVFPTAEEATQAAAQLFVELANNAVKLHSRFAVALAGGNTPRRMYEQLASEQFRDRVDWSVVHLFFGDERSVSRDHPDSNYRMAYEALISHVDIPTSNVHAISGEGNPSESAARYEAELREFFPDSSQPAFDLVVLGLGDDGHTASLFPGTEALNATKWVVGNWVEKLGSHRITLTASAINNAGDVIFLVTGANKASAVRAVLEGPPEPERLPAQLIQPEAGTLTWLLDSRAASLLSRTSS